MENAFFTKPGTAGGDCAISESPESINSILSKSQQQQQQQQQFFIWTALYDKKSKYLSMDERKKARTLYVSSKNCKS